MVIKWQGHACFQIQGDGVRIVTDPYTPEVAGLSPIREPADIVIMSSDDDDFHSDAAGVPVGARADFVPIPFDDVDALEGAVGRAGGGGVAAVVIEPVVERLPSREWVLAARRLCDATGAVLVFDEIKTGFRISVGGYQQYAGITPDLAVFSKALANGYPLSAVVGHADVMDAARATWISSTLASEGTALGAASAVLDRHVEADVCGALWSIGEEMRAGVTRAISASGVEGVRADGLAPMWLLRFDDPVRESRFMELALERGVLFKRGAYDFAALAHGDDDVLSAVELAASGALVALREEEEDGGRA